MDRSGEAPRPTGAPSVTSLSETTGTQDAGVFLLPALTLCHMAFSSQPQESLPQGPGLAQLISLRPGPGVGVMGGLWLAGLLGVPPGPHSYGLWAAGLGWGGGTLPGQSGARGGEAVPTQRSSWTHRALRASNTKHFNSN